MGQAEMPLAELLQYLERLANQSLALWDLPQDAKARLINVSENATYLVEAPGGHKSVLRIHREDYHSRRAIECELAWIEALNADGAIMTPDFYRGRNGETIQQASIEGLDHPRFMVLFHFVEGSAPDESGDLSGPFEELGTIAAQTHLHSVSWQRPGNFERLTWDEAAIFGKAPNWGNWRDAPGVDKGVSDILEQVEATICARLAKYGKGPERYGLIHADMRLANLLIGKNGTRLIDFDDCGIGWLMYDFAASISFIEDNPQIPALKAAWLRGYRKLRHISQEDETEIETFVMLRRMALLAWIGSHIEAPEPQALAPGFAATTGRLGKDYLRAIG